MALTVMSPAAFASSNVALQGNLVKISFPLATDKNNYDTSVGAITYQIRSTTQPIYVGGTATSAYIFRETTDQPTVSAWTTVTNIVVEGGLGTTRITMPSFPTDMTIKYEIRALDDANLATAPVLTSTNYYIIKNTYPILSNLAATWSGTANNIVISGTIQDTGFSYPANSVSTNTYTAAQWTAWRTGLSNVFGNITFTIQYRSGNTSNPTGAITSSGVSFTLTARDWFRSPSFSFTITNTNNAYNPDSTYYFRLHLNKSAATTASNATVFNTWNNSTHLVTLINQNPVFQIKKGTIKNNMPKADTARTGGGMFSHSAEQTAEQSPDRGHSIALYDHHIISGSTTAANQPSIGFFNTNHAELASIRYNGTNLVARIRSGEDYIIDRASVKPTTVVVGTVSAGHTAQQCDFLCPGTRDGDNQVIQRAIYRITSGTGGEVKFLNGLYNITSINVNGSGAMSNVKLSGTGKSTRLFGALIPQQALISFSNTSYVDICDIAIDSIQITVESYITGFTMSNVRMNSLSNYGVSFPLVETTAYRTIINSCSFSMNSKTSAYPLNGISLSGDTAVIGNCNFSSGNSAIISRTQDTTITGNTFINQTIGIDCSTSTAAISGNKIRDATKGIYIGSYGQVAISGNFIEDCTRGVEFGTTTSEGCVIGNTILRGEVAVSITNSSLVTFNSTMNRIAGQGLG